VALDFVRESERMTLDQAVNQFTADAEFLRDHYSAGQAPQGQFLPRTGHDFFRRWLQPTFGTSDSGGATRNLGARYSTRAPNCPRSHDTLVTNAILKGPWLAIFVEPLRRFIRMARFLAHYGDAKEDSWELAGTNRAIVTLAKALGLAASEAQPVTDRTTSTRQWLDDSATAQL
jgi:hypothetical protein